MSSLKERALNLIIEYLDYVIKNESDKITYSSYFNDYKYENDYIEIEYKKGFYPLTAYIKSPLTSAYSNPVICVDEDGEVYRCHGEHTRLLVYIILKLEKDIKDYFDYFNPEQLENIKSLIK